MADTIKIGSLDISAFKVGSDDCKIYLGDTLLYSGGTTPPTPTYKWVSYNEGDTIPSKLFYGVKLYLDLGADNEIDFQDTQQGGRGIVFMYVAEADGWYGIDIDTSSEIDLSSYYDSSEGCYIVLFSDLGYGGSPIIYPSEQFEFDVQLYEESQPTPPPSTELQWVTYSIGDTIPNDTYIFGIKGNGDSIGYNIYGEYLKFTPDRNRVDVEIVDAVSLLTCYSDNPFISEDLEYVLSAISCSNCVVQGNTLSYGGTSIQLLTYPTNPQLVTLSEGDTIPEGYVFGASGYSQEIGSASDILQIGTDSDNCVTLGHGAPTRAPEFTAYLYVVSNGTATMADDWMGKSKKVLFPNYSGAQHYYYEDGTKTVPFDVALYMIQIT